MVFGVQEGQDEPLLDFRPPAHTGDAAWADDDHLWLLGAQVDYEYRQGAWIKRCDFDGRCETVVTIEKPGFIVLGGSIY